MRPDNRANGDHPSAVMPYMERVPAPEDRHLVSVSIPVPKHGGQIRAGSLQRRARRCADARTSTGTRLIPPTLHHDHLRRRRHSRWMLPNLAALSRVAPPLRSHRCHRNSSSRLPRPSSGHSSGSPEDVGGRETLGTRGKRRRRRERASPSPRSRDSAR